MLSQKSITIVPPVQDKKYDTSSCFADSHHQGPIPTITPNGTHDRGMGEGNWSRRHNGNPVAGVAELRTIGTPDKAALLSRDGSVRSIVCVENRSRAWNRPRIASDVAGLAHVDPSESVLIASQATAQALESAFPGKILERLRGSRHP